MYAAVLGVAVAALGVDHFLLSEPITGPAGAAAAQPAALAVVPGLDAAAFKSEPIAAISADIAARLESFRGETATAESMTSILALPAEWFPAPEEPQSDADKSAQPAAVYKLTAVAAGGHSFVVVNKRRLRLGDVIDGMTLIEIRGRQATFQSGDQKIVLEMESPDQPAGDKSKDHPNTGIPAPIAPPR